MKPHPGRPAPGEHVHLAGEDAGALPGDALGMFTTPSHASPARSPAAGLRHQRFGCGCALATAFCAARLYLLGLMATAACRRRTPRRRPVRPRRARRDAAPVGTDRTGRRVRGAVPSSFTRSNDGICRSSSLEQDRSRRRGRPPLRARRDARRADRPRRGQAGGAGRRAAGGAPPAPTTSPPTSPRSSGATTPSGRRSRSGSASTERGIRRARRFRGPSPGIYD